jgi:hypothetical protein
VLRHSLLSDGALHIEAEPSLAPALARWLPLVPPGAPPAADAVVVALTVARAAPPPPPRSPRTLEIGRVRCWVERESAVLRGAEWLHGEVSLASGRARIEVSPAAADAAAPEWEVFAACTIAAALMLGRLGRSLVHAAAVVAGDGRAWLLAGDTHAGKTTTTANLLALGWRYLSDDHVILSRAPGGAVEVEGWPRPFHIDHGWEQGVSLGHRGSTDPRERWPDRWVRTAPLAGVLLPRVEAPAATRLEEVAPAGVLAALLRQSPWLLADRAAAPRVLDLLSTASALPARALRLGLDSYRTPEVLGRVVGPLAR